MTEAWKQYEGQLVDGRFHLRQYVGGSDHSAVFLTELDQVPQKAAIKFIPADPETSEIQLSHWQRAAKLSHSHLIQIFRMGRCHLGGRDLLFVVMDFAEENLAQILPHRALAPAEAGDMLPPVLDALAYVHGQGLVHGHLKPSNIMAVQDQLKISSDGLRVAGPPMKNSPDANPNLAPEVATGTMPASDLWSLGMTLVEVLTQRPLLWNATMRGEPVVPETVPWPFRNIASHCLRQDPRLRWSLAEVASALQSPAADSGKRIVAGMTRNSPDAPSKPFNKSRVVGPIVAVAVLLLAIFGGRKLFNHSSEPDQGAAAVSSSKPPAAETPKPVATPVDQSQPSSPTASPRNSARAAKPTASGPDHGAVLQQVLPEVSASARHTIEGRIRVRVRVNVDSSGNVEAAKFESAGPSKYFANKSMDAARRWKFTPPRVDGQAGSSVWVLKFAIGRTSTTVQSARSK